MEVTIPAILVRLAQSGVSVRWRDGRAVFRAAAAPPADIVTLIEACKADISAFLHPDAVQRRLDAEAHVLRAPCPPDVNDDRWATALDGLRAFIAARYGDEAQRLGWPRDELYAVPRRWAHVSLCGCALLIGDKTIVGVTPAEIRIKTSSDGTTAFYRKPEIDYALVFAERFKLLIRNLGHDEGRLRAIEYTVRFYLSQNPSANLEQATKLVRAAIAKAKEKV